MSEDKTTNAVDPKPPNTTDPAPNVADEEYVLADDAIIGHAFRWSVIVIVVVGSSRQVR